MDSTTSLSRLLIASALIVFETVLVISYAEAFKVKCFNPDASPDSNCRSFYRCTNRSVREVKDCEPDALFAPNQQTKFDGTLCVPSGSYQCPPIGNRQSSPYMDMCEQKANGLYPSPVHGCGSYVRCARGHAEVKECPQGQYFDVELSECSDAKRRCFEMGVSVDCDGKAEGYYMNDGCESYYHCFRDHKVEYRCSVGNIFNGSSCVPYNAYSCPKFDGDGFCHNRTDGYYKDPSNDSCRTYHFCSNGYKITYLCEERHFFDEKTKKCVRILESDLELRCLSRSPCYGKSEGYHADLRSNCKNYFYCKHNEKLTQLTCRDNVFNGHKCVSPQQYACPSIYNYRQINCVPEYCAQQCRQKDGFYIDLNSDCRDYFSCIGGKRSRLSCPSGRRFNGEICVAEDKFRCPVFCAGKTNAHSACPNELFF